MKITATTDVLIVDIKGNRIPATKGKPDFVEVDPKVGKYLVTAGKAEPFKELTEEEKAKKALASAKSAQTKAQKAFEKATEKLSKNPEDEALKQAFEDSKSKLEEASKKVVELEG